MWILNNGDEGLQATEAIEIDAIPGFGTADETSVLQDSEVLGDGGLRKREFINDLAADSSFFAGKEPENSNPGWVADGFGETTELFVGFGAFEGG